MRIPSGVTDQFIYFVGTLAGTRVTGLSSFTVYQSRNGAAAAVISSLTINETDSTNMPGVYELLMNQDMALAAGNHSEEMIFHITEAGMDAVDRTIEIYRPDVTAGETITVSSGAVSNVTLAATLTTYTGNTPQTADHTAGIADIPTVAEFNARTLVSADYFDPAVDAVANVTLTATTTAVTNELQVNVVKINSVAVIGAGISSDLWRA